MSHTSTPTDLVPTPAETRLILLFRELGEKISPERVPLALHEAIFYTAMEGKPEYAPTEATLDTLNLTYHLFALALMPGELDTAGTPFEGAGKGGVA